MRYRNFRLKLSMHTAATTGGFSFSRLVAAPRLFATSTAFAQGYPSRPARVTVPFAIGSAPDAFAHRVREESARRSRIIRERKLQAK